VRPVRGGVSGGGALDRGSRGTSGGKLPWRLDTPQLRPPPPPPPPHRRRGPAPGAPLPPGTPRRPQGVPHARDLASAGLSAVRALTHETRPQRGA